MRSIGVCPSISSHGGIIIPASARISTVDGVPPVLDGDWHICPLKHHGVTFIQGTGFATDTGRRYGLFLDRCGCGAYIVFSSPTVTSD